MKRVFAVLLACVLEGSADTVPYDVRGEVQSVVTTNDVDAKTYATRTNGYTWVDGASWFQYAAGLIIGGYNNSLSVVNSVDPFAERVETKYYCVVSQDIYRIVTGPFTNTAGSRFTVLDRWKVITRKKISMEENVEKVRE